MKTFVIGLLTLLAAVYGPGNDRVPAEKSARIKTGTKLNQSTNPAMHCYLPLIRIDQDGTNPHGKLAVKKKVVFFAEGELWRETL